MRCLLFVSLCALLSFTARAQDEGDSSPSVQGEWAVTSMRLFGGQIPEEQAKQLKLVFTKDKIAITPGFAVRTEERGPILGKRERSVSLVVGGKPMEDFYAADLGKKPGTFDFLDAKGKPGAKGIIEIKADTIRLFVDAEGRPKSFDSEGSKKALYFEVMRIPAKKK